MTNKRILDEANKILISLRKLQDRARKIVDRACRTRFYTPPHIDNVLDALDELSNFDLEDSIVNAYDYED